MQGVRQADLRLGETCIIIGIGLLGQLAALILKASGISVIGIDVSEVAVNLAKTNNVCDFTFNRNTPGLEEKINTITAGIGADSVIIAAAFFKYRSYKFCG